MYKNYCDSNTTKMMILKTNPANSGLYFHELYMLYCISKGMVTSKRNGCEGFFKYEFGVEYPYALVQHLLRYGYVSINDSQYIWDVMCVNDLKKIFVFNKIKCPRTKAEMVQFAKEKFPSSKVPDILGYDYYTLTCSGKNAMDEFEQWKYEDIMQRKSKAMYVLFGASTFQSKDDLEQLIPKSIDFVIDYEQKSVIARSNNSVFIGEGLRFRFEVPKITIDDIIKHANVCSVLFLFNQEKIIVFTKDVEENCFCYNLNTKQLVFKEKVSDSVILNPTSQYIYDGLEECKKEVSTPNEILLYFSTNSEFSKLLVFEYLAKQDGVKVELLENIIKEDSSKNFCVTIPKSNLNLIEFVMFLIIEKIFMPIQIFGARIDNVYRFLKLQSSLSFAVKEIVREDYHNRLNVIQSYDMIKKHMPYGEFINALIKRYPSNVITASYSNYSTGKRYGKDPYFYEVIQNKKIYEQMYHMVVLSLREQKLIPTKWRNEFELYLLIKDKYKDAIFQYRDDWLGLQSLDIFLPKQKIGIEYQGIQHFEPIEFFGGIEAFEKRKRLDRIKKELCEKNGVKLIYWNYDETINAKELMKKINNLS